MTKKSRNRSTAPVSADSIESIGQVRRSQLITTFGIGAIADLEKGSFMPLGLEMWEPVSGLPSLRISEPRLQSMLNVSHFRLAPILDNQYTSDPKFVRANKAIPALRFPKWHECPNCHRLGTLNDPFELADDGGRLVCTPCGDKCYTSPVRFVVACRNGHIDDFPWIWWAHQNSESVQCKNPVLRLHSHGQSASLADLFVRCDRCKSVKSLGDAFTSEKVSRFSCSRNRPWLLDREKSDCEEKVRVLQRGASNVHFGAICSAISIPPASESASQLVQELQSVLDAVPESALDSVIEGLAQQYGTTFEKINLAYRQLRDMDDHNSELTEHQSRRDEYVALSSDRNDNSVICGIIPEFRNNIKYPKGILENWFERIGAVSRLREVRVLTGFSRLDPHPIAADRVNSSIREGKISPLSKSPRNWLPAVEIRGEGIFFKFRTEAIDSWIGSNSALKDRACVLESLGSQYSKKRKFIRDYEITPRLLLVHSFSHALIRQISIECGYSASAIRERLYVSESEGDLPPMNGVLIYTGSPDSEGSLGGLVRLAEPKLLEPIVIQSLESAEWCGSDPVCIESDPNLSGERLCGAACHSCLLLPETACEKFNRELDRSVLMGNSNENITGYFEDMRQ